jgi:hypothetical protein
MRKIHCLLTLLVVLVPAAPTAEPADSLPPLIYTVTLKSEAVDSGSLGLLPALISKAYLKTHDQFLDALKQNSANDPQGLLHPLACVGGVCRRLMEQPAGAGADWLTMQLASEPTHTARMANITIIFDGRFFQVPINFHDVKLNALNQPVMENPTTVTYIRTYSRSQHAEEVRTQRIDTPFDGKIGSREAHLHFWLGGSNPHLMQDLRKAFELEAALWEARLSPQQADELSAALANKKNLPRMRDVTGKDPNCKLLHPAFPVVKDLGDYLWLSVPGDASKVGNSFFIEPRCGFDY